MLFLCLGGRKWGETLQSKGWGRGGCLPSWTPGVPPSPRLQPLGAEAHPPPEPPEPREPCLGFTEGLGGGVGVGALEGGWGEGTDLLSRHLVGLGHEQPPDAEDRREGPG